MGERPGIPRPEGWTPLLVHWNESDHAPREVIKACKRCLPDGLPLICRVVSPKGVAHETTGGDVTDCGHDCLSYKNIGGVLDVERCTIQRHLQVARYKLGARNTAQACVEAMRLGLIQ